MNSVELAQAQAEMRAKKEALSAARKKTAYKRTPGYKRRQEKLKKRRQRRKAKLKPVLIAKLKSYMHCHLVRSNFQFRLRLKQLIACYESSKVVLRALGLKDDALHTFMRIKEQLPQVLAKVLIEGGLLNAASHTEAVTTVKNSLPT